MNAGAFTYLWGDVKCAFCDVDDKDEADRLQAIGIGIAVVGVLMIAAGVPMAIVGGRKESPPAPAAQNGLVRVLTF